MRITPFTFEVLLQILFGAVESDMESHRAHAKRRALAFRLLSPALLLVGPIIFVLTYASISLTTFEDIAARYAKWFPGFLRYYLLLPIRYGKWFLDLAIRHARKSPRRHRE